MTKKEELKAILDRYSEFGECVYVDDGDEAVRITFDQPEVRGEISISDVGILNLFLATLSGIKNIETKSSDVCEVAFFCDLIDFATKKLGKKKGIRIKQKDLNALILIASFLKNLIEQQDD